MDTEWHDIRVKEGASWRAQIRVRQGNGSPYPLGAVTLHMQIRDEVTAAAVRFDLTVGDGLSIDEETGIITISIDAEQTTGILRGGKPRALYSDLEVSGDGPPAWSDVWVSIRWIVTAKVTRDD